MIQGTTHLVGVFGYPVRHSASPPMHNAAFAALGLDWAYVPFTVAPQTVAQAVTAISALGLRGVNVTVPLKELVPAHLHELTPRAHILGAVNTIVNRDGYLLGDSTDGPGFLAAITHGGLPIEPGFEAVVLGAGGSARAVIYALAAAGVSVTVANRDIERANALARDFAEVANIAVIPMTPEALTKPIGRAQLLVNTTSVGMHPDVDGLPPIPESALHPDLFVSDLIYNPRETRLLALARQRGCRTQNGIEMLVRQGALAFTQWTGVEPPIDVMRDAVNSALQVPR